MSRDKHMTEKHLQAKRKHHHVWANYLMRWSTTGKEVYYSTKTGKIATDSVKAIAVEKDFYQIKPLRNDHLKLIKYYWSLSSESLQEIHNTYIADFLSLQRLEEIYLNGNVKNQEIDNDFNSLRCNLLENLHSAHESEVQIIMSSIANGKIDTLNKDENMLLMMGFFGHQLSRTKNFKEKILLVHKKLDEKAGTTDYKLIDECWWLLSYMFGTNIGFSIYTKRKTDKHCLLLNNSATPFITSDQPIINTHKALQNAPYKLDDDRYDFYYPISPNVAYMINESDRFQRGINYVSAEIVNEFNVKLTRNANVHIIGNSESSLKPLLKYVGQHLNNIHNEIHNP
jgi:hypothetical protein